MNIVAVSIALVLCVSAALADPVKLTASEVTGLLSGNTAVGQWDGTPYRQIFETSGRTVYAEKNAPHSQGRWRTNAGTGSYESWWQNSGWSAYEVWRDGDVHFWRGGGQDRAEFSVEPGLRLGFPD
ncbi:MAG: hypothetical protein AAF409_20615 [Pseudomonadota bacterium]